MAQIEQSGGEAFKDGPRHIWFWSFDFTVNKSSLVCIFLSSYDCNSTVGRQGILLLTVRPHWQLTLWDFMRVNWIIIEDVNRTFVSFHHLCRRVIIAAWCLITWVNTTVSHESDWHITFWWNTSWSMEHTSFPSMKQLVSQFSNSVKNKKGYILKSCDIETPKTTVLKMKLRVSAQNPFSEFHFNVSFSSLNNKNYVSIKLK